MFTFKFDKVLEEINSTRNSISVESKVRPATIQDLYTGDTKRIELATIGKVLDAINEKARSYGIEKTYTLNDIISYEYSKDAE